MNSQRGLYKIRRLLTVQLITIFLLTVGGFCFYDNNIALSVLMGGVVYLLPNLYFAAKVFGHSGATQAKKIVNSFYQGEAIKIVISIALFILIFKVIKVAPFPFFMTYILLQLTIWLAPWVI